MLHVIASSAFGGAERVVATLLRTTDRDRFEVLLACPGDGPMLEEYRRAADDVWAVESSTIFSRRSVGELVRVMRHVDADVVHTHLWSADVLGAMAARRAGAPALVSTVHGGYFHRVDERGMKAVRKWCLSRVFRSAYLPFDRVVAVSGQLAEDLSSRSGLKVPASKVTVIRNGVDVALPSRPAAPASRAALGVPASGPLIATIANFAPMKGHRTLVEAMPQVLAGWPDATFLLVGVGRELGSVHDLVERAGLAERVQFLGARDDAVNIMAHSDVVVLPSVAAEGIPITIIEALALGRPVVATRIGGIPEVITHGVTGLLVAPRDSRALADAMASTLSDRAAAAGMGDRGRQLVEGQFSASRMVRQVEQVYTELLAGRPRRSMSGASV